MGVFGALAKVIGALPNARNVAEDMARTILELRAAGKADEVTEEMMSAADDPYMFENTPLDMSQEALMARADEMGASSDLYHMTDKDFSSFANPTAEGMQGKGVYASYSPDISHGLGSLVDDSGAFVEGTNTMPVRFIGETFKDGGSGNDLDPFSEEGTAILKRFGLRPNKNYSEIKGAENADGINSQIYDVSERKANKTHKRFSQEWLEEVRRLENERIQKAGYTSTLDEYRGYEMAFEPKNVRSKFARFDPEFRNLRNLSAGFAAIGFSGLAAGLKEKEEGGGI